MTLPLPAPIIDDPNREEKWPEIVDRIQKNLDAISLAIPDGGAAARSNYKLLTRASFGLVNDAGAGTYVLIDGNNSASFAAGAVTSSFPPPGLVYLYDGEQRNLVLRAQVAANGTAPAITFTFGLYPITISGAADTLTFTAGTVVSGSTAAIASPSANTTTAASSSVFDGAVGLYGLACLTSGTLTNNSRVGLMAQLFTRSF